MTNRISRQRLEYVQLAAALPAAAAFESGSKLHALQALRALSGPLRPEAPAKEACDA